MRISNSGSSLTTVVARMRRAARPLCVIFTFLSCLLVPHQSLGQCTTPVAGAPALASDTVWVDDDLPPDSSPGDVWIWDTSQRASGSQSHTQPAAGGLHQHFFNVDDAHFLWVSATDTLVTYVLLDPCNPPTELMLQFSVPGLGWEHRAYWGSDATGWGADGTESRRYMGPLPPAGRWVRLEVPASLVGVDGEYLDGMAFTLYDGRAWFDRSGKAGTCVLGTAPVPSVLPGDTVWFDDALPEGSDTDGNWIWDPSQKMSGAVSHTEGAQPFQYQHLFFANEQPLPVSAGDTFVQYVLLDPCEAPSEVMLQLLVDGSWEHRAFWGEDLIDWGSPGTEQRRYMGALPAPGAWARLEVPVAAVGISENKDIGGVAFVLSNGRAWFDRTGKNAAPLPSLGSIALSPSTLAAGGSATGTLGLSGPAPATGASISLQSSDEAVAAVPSLVTIPAGQTSTTFTVATFPKASDSSATITATYLAGSQAAALLVTANAPAVLSALSISPAATLAGAAATGTVTLSSAAPAGGASVALATSDPLVATVPASVLVASGQTSASFTISSGSVPSDCAVEISAKYLGGVQSAWLSVVTGSTVSLVSVTVNPSSVEGGSPATGTVTLSAPAPAGGVFVGLASNSPFANVPSSVNVLEGAATASFAVSTSNVVTATAVTVSASFGGDTKTAVLTVLPCVPLQAPPPSSFPSTDVLWFDDNLPPNSVPQGTWIWDTSQRASGTSSHTDPPAPGLHQHYFQTDVDHRLYLAATDDLVVYALLSPCDPPREILLQFDFGGFEFRAYWGEDLIPLGTPGTTSRYHAGPLPPAGQWARLAIPAAAVGLGGRSISGIAFTLYDGQVWFDRAAKAPTCVTPAAAPPSPYPPDTIWVNDALPAGATGHRLVWDASQKASGALSHTHAPDFGPQDHYFDGVETAATLEVSATDKLVLYALIDPCDPTREIFVRWNAGGWEHGAFWGEDLVDVNPPGAGRVNRGALPTPGQWTRLEVPASAVALGGSRVGAMQFFTYSGRVWFDGVGKTNATGTAALVGLSAAPASVVSGAVSTGTLTLTGPAPSGGVLVSLASDNTSAATVPATVTVPAGDSSATFPIATLGVGGSVSVGITATDGSSTFSAPLTVHQATLSALSVSPAAVVAATSATGTVSLNGLAGPGGHVIDLSSDSTSAHVPPTNNVVVPQGSSSATFTITTSQVSSTTLATITARADSVTRTAGLTITPCSFASAPSPASFPPDTIWFDDSTPADANLFGTWLWDPGQKASGTQSHTEPVATGSTQHGLTTNGASSLRLAPGDRLVVYALLDPCFPPRELMLQWNHAGSWEHRAFWGEDLMGLGQSGTESRVYMGSLPTPGQWTRLEIPASSLGLDGQTIDGIAFTLFDGEVWFDRPGKVNQSHTPVLAAVSVSPSSLTGGTSATGTVTLTGAALSGGLVVNLSSQNPAVVSVPATVTVLEGATTAAFAVTTTAVGAATTAVLTATDATETRTATVTVTPATAPTLSAVSLNPASVTGGNASTGTVTLSSAALASGFAVGLASDNGSASVPSSVTVPQGAMSATFTVTTSTVSSVQTATITATAGGVTRTASLTINPPTVTGVVKDAVTQNAILGAAVTLLGTSNSVTTDASGQFAISGPPGLAALRISKTGYVDATTLPFGISPSTPTALGATYLSPRATVTGIAQDSYGRPVPSLTVTVLEDGASARTDSAGAFTLSRPPGLSTLHFDESSSVVLDVPVTLAAGETRSLGVVALVGWTGFTWTAYPSGGAFPLATTFTAASGSATFTDPRVPPGTYTATISSPGYLSQTFGPYTLAAGDNKDLGQLTFIRCGTLVGTVASSADGSALAGASVTAGGASAMTDAHGNFLLSLAAGSYPVTVTMAGFASLTTAAQGVVQGDERSAGIISLSPQAPPTGSVTGVVVNALGGGPVPGASVTLVGGSGNTVTDATGAFLLSAGPGCSAYRSRRSSRRARRMPPAHSGSSCPRPLSMGRRHRRRPSISRATTGRRSTCRRSSRCSRAEPRTPAR